MYTDFIEDMVNLSHDVGRVSKDYTTIYDAEDIPSDTPANDDLINKSTAPTEDPTPKSTTTEQYLPINLDLNFGNGTAPVTPKVSGEDKRKQTIIGMSIAIAVILLIVTIIALKK